MHSVVRSLTSRIAISSLRANVVNTSSVRLRNTLSFTSVKSRQFSTTVDSNVDVKTEVEPKVSATVAEVSPITPVGPAIDPALLSGDFTLHSLLNEEQKVLLRDIKSILTDSPNNLRALSLSKQDILLLRNAVDALDELFLVVVVGEFNSGKSNFINALLGAKHCRTGVLPTTETVQILRYGPKREEKMTGPNRSIRTVSVPVPWLRQANLVDTPGTNAVLQEHQEITEKFVPSADIILFVTSVERPFSESEKQFLSRIYSWKKKVVLVLNKADLVVPEMESTGLSDVYTTSPSTPAANPTGSPVPFEDGTVDNGTSFAQILDFVRTNAKKVLSEIPPVFGVSSRLALEGKLAMTSASNGTNAAGQKMSSASANAALVQGRALVANSGFADLENYILSQLTAENKIKLKLSNPLALVENILAKYEVVLEARLEALAHDVETRELLNREIADFTKEVQADYQQQVTKLDNIFLRMKMSSGTFLQKQVRLVNVGSLVLNKDKLRDSYTQQVHEGVTQEVDEAIRGLSSWLVAKTAKQAQSLASIMQRYPPVHIPSPSSMPMTIPLSAPVLMREPSELSASEADAPVEESVVNVALTAKDIQQHAENVRTAGVDFHQSRLDMLHEMQQSCLSIVSDQKRLDETNRMVSSIQKGVVTTAAFEVSAVGLSALFAAALFDVTGLAGAGALAVAGLAILPSQRISLTKDINAKIDLMHSSLKTSLTTQYLREIDAAERALTQAITPFNRYVAHEEEKLNEIKLQVESTHNEINRLRTEIFKSN